jgi:hypothetical protein
MEIPSMGDIWDSIIEDFSYLLSFDWISDMGGFFSGFFENMSDFSIAGLIQGLITAAATFYVMGKLDFVINSPLPTRIGYYFIFSLIMFVWGYLSGRKIWE